MRSQSAAGRERAAVDDRDGDRLAAVVDLDLRAARQRLVRDADGACASAACRRRSCGRRSRGRTTWRSRRLEDRESRGERRGDGGRRRSPRVDDGARSVERPSASVRQRRAERAVLRDDRRGDLLPAAVGPLALDRGRCARRRPRRPAPRTASVRSSSAPRRDRRAAGLARAVGLRAPPVGRGRLRGGRARRRPAQSAAASVVMRDGGGRHGFVGVRLRGELTGSRRDALRRSGRGRFAPAGRWPVGPQVVPPLPPSWDDRSSADAAEPSAPSAVMTRWAAARTATAWGAARACPSRPGRRRRRRSARARRPRARRS